MIGYPYGIELFMATVGKKLSIRQILVSHGAVFPAIFEISHTASHTTRCSQEKNFAVDRPGTWVAPPPPIEGINRASSNGIKSLWSRQNSMGDRQVAKALENAL